MKKVKYLIAALAASFVTVMPAIAAGCSRDDDEKREAQRQVQDDNNLLEGNGGSSSENENNIPDSGVTPPENGTTSPEVNDDKKPEEDKKPSTVAYFTVTSEGVNIRSGAGTGYAVRGQAEKSTLYAFNEKDGEWYKTGYRNKSGYISSKYCTLVNMPTSGNELIEAVIEEGTKLLGTPYVYGAVRLHDGRGNIYKSFTTDEFDCSSLMQYIFYKGADKLLDVNTRTQVYQGKTVTKSQLRRGDLMFFTNAERKNKTGVERIGHVALYLGEGYILHTASDYAKIEKISTARWNNFIQGQRII